MVKDEEQKQFAKLFKGRITSIEKQIADLQSDLEAMKRAGNILFEESIRPASLDDITPISNELKGVKPTLAILKILDGDPTKSWSATEMCREMKKRGHIPSSKHFPSMISSTLFRLAKNNRIETIEKKGEPTRFKKKAEG